MKNSNNLQQSVTFIIKNSISAILIFISLSSFGQSGPSFSIENENNSYIIKTETQPTNNGSFTVSSKVWYETDGSIVKSVRYYNEQSLPPYIASKVHKQFNGKKIYGVTEESSSYGINYLIVLEDEKFWYHVTSNANGDIDLKIKLIKA